MQERSGVIVIALVLAICCLGLYVGVSGFQNSQQAIALLSGTKLPASPATMVVVVLRTETPGPLKATATVSVPEASVAVPSPLGAVPTVPLATAAAGPGTSTPVVRPAQLPTATLTALAPTIPPTAVPLPPTAAPQPCGGFTFCVTGGPPDPQLAPTGDQCPRNYIWGRIVDVNGRGLPNMNVRFKTPLGSSDKVESKGAPDPPGIYNIPAPPPGGNWTLWLVDGSGAQMSPQMTIVAPQPYTGMGNCLTRIDFKAQR